MAFPMGSVILSVWPRTSDIQRLARSSWEGFRNVTPGRIALWREESELRIDAGAIQGVVLFWVRKVVGVRNLTVTRLGVGSAARSGQSISR